MKKLIPICLFAPVFFAIFACGGGDKPPLTPATINNTPTSGLLTVYIEEGYQPILSTTIDVFDSIYDRADVTGKYMSESEAVRGLIEKETPLIIISRPLTENERIPFENRGIIPEQTLFAYDGLAFIVHPDNVDSIFTMEEMKDLMLGKYETWGSLNPKNKAGKMNIVFDHQGSGTVKYVRDSVAMGDLAKFTAALKTNEEVISYVSKNKSAIGVISANWISDTDDKGSQAFLKSVKLVGIAKAVGEESFTPYQAYLATGEYAYKRPVYLINATPRKFSLAQGFASFVAGPIGQRIIHKDGLLPATMPIRLMQFEKE